MDTKKTRKDILKNLILSEGIMAFLLIVLVLHTPEVMGWTSLIGIYFAAAVTIALLAAIRLLIYNYEVKVGSKKTLILGILMDKILPFIIILVFIISCLKL